jgi:hypothetical protein
MGAMYAIAEESKAMCFSGPIKSRHSPATSFSASRVHGALTREVQLELSFFDGDRRWSRRGFVV